MRMCNTVLMAGDEPGLGKLARRALSDAGYAVVAASWDDLFNESPMPLHDAVLLDLTAEQPGSYGLVGFRSRSESAIIALVSHKTPALYQAALDCGADDFLIVPFDCADLVTRVRLAIRKRLIRDGGVAICRGGNVLIDLVRPRVLKASREVHLTRKEFLVLRQLARFPGRLVTHDEIIGSLWPERQKNSIGYLRTLVRTLRQKLEDHGQNGRLIQNEAGHGYRLRALPV